MPATSGCSREAAAVRKWSLRQVSLYKGEGAYNLHSTLPWKAIDKPLTLRCNHDDIVCMCTLLFLRLFKTEIKISSPLLVAFTHYNIESSNQPPTPQVYKYFLQLHTTGSPSRVFLDLSSDTVLVENSKHNSRINHNVVTVNTHATLTVAMLTYQ